MPIPSPMFNCCCAAGSGCQEGIGWPSPRVVRTVTLRRTRLQEKRRIECDRSWCSSIASVLHRCIFPALARGVQGAPFPYPA